VRTFRIATARREEFVDVTSRVASAVAESGVSEGICLVQSVHTTCGITVNENADPDVRSDLLRALARAVSDAPAFRHAEGNSAAHMKTSMMGVSVCLAVSGGRLALGTWQGVYLCEFDGPRERTVAVSVVPG